MELTLKKVRQALSDRTDLCYIETVKREPGIQLNNPKTLHAVPYGGVYEFKVWPKQPSKNTDYLNKIFESLPGYTKSYADDPYHIFRYGTDGTLYFPLPYSFSESLGTYEKTLTFSITNEGFRKKLEGTLNTKTKKVFAYKRIPGKGDYVEKRLMNKLSCGLGGHIDREDSADPIMNAMMRELEEEIEMKTYPHPSYCRGSQQGAGSRPCR
jgi:hypothetical protein